MVEELGGTGDSWEATLLAALLQLVKVLSLRAGGAAAGAWRHTRRRERQSRQAWRHGWQGTAAVVEAADELHPSAAKLEEADG